MKPEDILSACIQTEIECNMKHLEKILMFGYLSIWSKHKKNGINIYLDYKIRLLALGFFILTKI